MELLFHKRWWDYSYDLINMNGRVSLRNSSCLAIGATLLIYIIQPILNKFVPKKKTIITKTISIIIISVMVIDFAITIAGYIIK
jgi:uncharacterized membrane protein